MVTAMTGINAQLLYRISAKDLKQPSYIVGTYHFAPASFVDSIPGLRDAMRQTAQVCGELDMNLAMNAESAQKMIAAMMMPDGKSLKDILTTEEQNKLNAYMKGLMGADMTNPMVEQQMGKMSPQALTTQFTLLTYMRNTPGFDPANLIDNYFQKVALEEKKPVMGLESVDFQIKTLYKSMSTERQKEQLMCLVDNPEYNKMMILEMAKAYFNKDINKLKDVMDEKQNNSCDSTPQEKAELTDNRNADWITKMPAIMSTDPTLFVVGAGHLPGDNGVLKLLEKAGYTVEAIK